MAQTPNASELDGWTSPTAVLLIGMALVVAGLLGFILVADAVRDGDTQAMDERVVRSLRKADNPAQPIGPPWLGEVGRDLTALGGVAVLVLVIAAVAGFLWLADRTAMMWFVLASVGGGLLVSSLLKGMFDRPRPAVVPHLSDVYTSSFPSGHSMMSATVYLTLGALLARLVAKKRLKFFVLTIAVFTTVFVGASRVFLGVHYPTDVLAGWLAGLAWSMACLSLAGALHRRGRLDGGRSDP